MKLRSSNQPYARTYNKINGKIELQAILDRRKSLWPKDLFIIKSQSCYLWEQRGWMEKLWLQRGRIAASGSMGKDACCTSLAT